MSVNTSAAINAYANALKNAATAPKNGAGDVVNEAAGGDFGSFLRDAVDAAVDVGKTSETQMIAGIKGGDTDLVDVVTAVSAAELTVQTVVSVRDKVIAAYQDIMKMPI